MKPYASIKIDRHGDFIYANLLLNDNVVDTMKCTAIDLGWCCRTMGYNNEHTRKHTTLPLSGPKGEVEYLKHTLMEKTML